MPPHSPILTLAQLSLNASTGTYEDLVQTGIIDPTLVVCTAIQNAASVAGLLLTTNVAITELKDDDEPIEQAIF